MRLLFSALSLLALAAITSAASVSLTMGPAPIGFILQSISQQTGEKYVVSDEIRSDFLVISVKDVDSKELLARIAQVTEGTWSIRGEEAVLSPDSRKARARAEAELKLRLEAFNKSIERFSVEPEDGPTTYSLLATLLKGQSKQTIERMVTERTVLSTNPNRLQVRLNGNSRPLVDLIVSETNQRAIETANAVNEMAELGPFLNLYKALGMDMSLMFPKPVTTEPAKLIIICDPDSQYGGDGMTFTALLADADQKILGSATLPIGGYLDDLMSMPDEVGEEAPPVESASERSILLPTLKNPDAKIAPSERASKLLLLMNRGNSAATALSPLTEDEEALLSRPDLNDPLSFGVKDTFDVFAAESKNSIVGLVPDNLFLTNSFGEESSIIVLALAYWQSYVEFEINEGWTVFTPTDFDKSRSARLNRSALATLIESGKANGMPRLDAWADYVRAGGLGESGPSTLESIYLNVLMGYADGFGSAIDPRALRVWAYLQNGQRDTIRQGRPVRLSNLNRDAMDAIYKWMLQPGSLGKSRTEPPPEGSRIFGMMMTGMSFGMFGISGTLWQEPTELLAGGLGEQAVIGALVSEEPFVRPVTLDDKLLSAFPSMGPEEYAFFSELFNGPMASEVSFPNRFEVGDRTMLDLIITPVPGWEMRGVLADMRIRPGRPKYGRGELPKEFLDRVAAANASFKKLGLTEFFQMMGDGGMGGRGERQDP